jgi:hypothetical protein
MLNSDEVEDGAMIGPIRTASIAAASADDGPTVGQ